MKEANGGRAEPRNATEQTERQRKVASVEQCRDTASVGTKGTGARGRRGCSGRWVKVRGPSRVPRWGQPSSGARGSNSPLQVCSPLFLSLLKQNVEGKMDFRV